MIDNEVALTTAAPRGAGATPRELPHHDPPLETAVHLYLREIGRVPLLTAAQEVALASRMAAGAEATSTLDTGALDTGTLRRDERRARESLIADAAVAQRHLTEANLRLVVSVAKRYAGRGLTLLDLIQEGNLGLMRAVPKFDHTRGTRFSTYATWWIRQAISRAIADQGRTIRLPVHVLETVHTMARTAGRLQQDHGRDATAEEVGREMGVTAAAVGELLTMTHEAVSLDAPVGDEGQQARVDLIPDDAPSPEDVVTRRLLQGQVALMLDLIPDREQQVLRRRFGFADGQCQTLDQVGIALGITRERVRQIEFRALRRLRGPQHRHTLGAFLD